MHANPLYIKKYLYIEKTSTWKVRTLYLFGIISWMFVVYGFLGMFFIDPFFRWFVAPIIGMLTLYHLISFGFNIFYRQFNLSNHLNKIKEFRDVISKPTVDIFFTYMWGGYCSFG